MIDNICYWICRKEQTFIKNANREENYTERTQVKLNLLLSYEQRLLIWEQIKAGKTQVDREQNHVRGRSRHESENSGAINSQQPGFFHNYSHAGPTISHRYTLQFNQQPLDSFAVSDGYYNNNYNNNPCNCFSSYRSYPPDCTQQQTRMFQNTLIFPKISTDNFSVALLKWHQWFSLVLPWSHRWTDQEIWQTTAYCLCIPESIGLNPD